MFLDHTQWRSRVGRTSLDEWSARRTDLYLTTHDTHSRQISMPPVGFEPKMSAGERPCRSPADISRLKVNNLTLILLTWRKWWAPNNASKKQMEINSGFKGLKSVNWFESWNGSTPDIWQHGGISFLISNFRRVLYVVCFLLGNFPASEFYRPTFRNTLSSIFIDRKV